jgi:hypothetical protein
MQIVATVAHRAILTLLAERILPKKVKCFGQGKAAATPAHESKRN